MNKFIQPLVVEINEEADKYVKEQKIGSVEFSGYEDYLATGRRKLFENQYFSRRRQLAVLGLANMLHPEKEKLQLLENLIWEICNEYTWAVPAHLPIHKEHFTKESRWCIDLFAAETAEALAEIQSKLKAHLSPFVSQRIHEEIHRRIFTPFLAKKWFWEDSRNNWSAVVAGCVGMTALFQLDSNDLMLEDILKKVDHCMQGFLMGYGDDGVCPEGIGYWTYGFGYYLYFAQMLFEIKKEDHYLNGEKVKNIAAFPAKALISDEAYLPFSDFGGGELPAGLLTYCKETFDVEIPKIKQINKIDFDNCYRFAHLSRNLFWSKPETTRKKSIADTHYFADVQWRVSHYDTFLFAAKAGKNNESHNHNDVGHFIFGSYNQLFLTDLGAGEYTREYFQEESRYRFLTTSSAGHSVPIINGQLQIAGNFAAKKVVSKRNYFALNIEEVYPAESRLEKLQRKFILDDKNKKVSIVDSFEFTTKNNIVIENFISLIKPQIEGNKVLLQQGSEKCVITMPTEAIEVSKKTFRNHLAEETDAYLIQGKFDTAIKAEIQLTIQLDAENNEIVLENK